MTTQSEKNSDKSYYLITFTEKEKFGLILV